MYYPKQFQKLVNANPENGKCTNPKIGKCTNPETGKCTIPDSETSYINKDKKYVDRINKEKRNK